MIAELLEKFEDLFQPASDEELEKRKSTYVVLLYQVRGRGLAHEFSKQVEIECKAFRNAGLRYKGIKDMGIKKMGLDIEKVNIVRNLGMIGYRIRISKDEKIYSNNGMLLSGNFVVLHKRKYK